MLTMWAPCGNVYSAVSLCLAIKRNGLPNIGYSGRVDSLGNYLEEKYKLSLVLYVNSEGSVMASCGG